MTLRVELSIIPYGDEDGKRVIHTINISNLGGIDFGKYSYGVEVDKYKTEQYDHYVTHSRDAGALKLASKVLKKILND